MVSDCRQILMASNDDQPTWGYLQRLTTTWWRSDMPDALYRALNPYLTFVGRVRNHSIPWRHRWHILWYGKLPEDF